MMEVNETWYDTIHINKTTDATVDRSKFIPVFNQQMNLWKRAFEKCSGIYAFQNVLYYTTHGTVSILQKSHNTNILKEPYCPYWRKIKCIDRRLGIKNPCLLHYRREKRSKITGLSPAFRIPSCQEIWQGAQTAFQAKRNLAQLAQKKNSLDTNKLQKKGK